jgi:polyphosphate kinase
MKKTGKPQYRDGYEINLLLETIRRRVMEQKYRQAIVYEQIVLELAKLGLIIEQSATPMGQELFENKVLPLLMPIRMTPESEVPNLKGGRLYFLADHPNSFSLIEMPAELPRFFITKSRYVHLVDQLIFSFKDLIFKNLEVREIFSFKISRDASIELTEDSSDYIDEVEEGIKHRDIGDIVRMEVDSVMLSSAVKWLQNKLKVPDDRLYQISLPLDLKGLMPITELKRGKKLRYNFPTPRRPSALGDKMHKQQFFRNLEKQDQLLHHPFSSFEPVVDLVRFAAEDPQVTRICQTLYRTSGKSPILEALVAAARSGKKVLALVEVKARFDEANNLKWARALEKAGVRVIYGTPDIKVHAKLTYVERKGLKGGPMREYVHISTGNYHPTTAKFYTDLGILSARPEYCAEARRLFDLFEKMDNEDDYSLLTQGLEFSKNFKHWVVAPANLHKQIIEWIHGETQNAKAGKEAYINAKMNGLVEESVIEALYEASQAGVKIDLLVRGMCCLRPGVKGLSENIRVRSIIDKYLEHSRVFIFGNGGQAKVWISSADWMPRNLFRRIELAVPVLDPLLAQYIQKVFWPIYAEDNVKARECLPDGRYIRNFSLGDQSLRAQTRFEELEVPNFEIPTRKITSSKLTK